MFGWLSGLSFEGTRLFRKHGLNPQSFTAWERAKLMPLLQAGTFDPVPEGCVIYDIGANVGRYATLFAKLSFCRTVVAWEPLPSAYAELTDKAKVHHSLLPQNVALGRESKSVRMFEDDYQQASSLLLMEDRHRKLFPMTGNQSVRQVDVRRLDHYVRENNLPSPYLVKLDVQGFEREVILGGLDSIKAARWCLLELSLLPLYKQAPLVSEMLELMEGLDFKLMEILRPLRGCDQSIISFDGLFRRVSATQEREPAGMQS